MKYSAQAYPKFKRTEEKNKPPNNTTVRMKYGKTKRKKIETIIVEQKKEKKLQKKATHNYT